MTKRKSDVRRGRPITERGAFCEEHGISRLDAWKWMRLAQIPEEQFEALLDEGKELLQQGKRVGTDWMLRRAGKLSPELPRPPERARIDAIDHLTAALEHMQQLARQLRETGSDSELEQAQIVSGEILDALKSLRLASD